MKRKFEQIMVPVLCAYSTIHGHSMGTFAYCMLFMSVGDFNTDGCPQTLTLSGWWYSRIPLPYRCRCSVVFFFGAGSWGPRLNECKSPPFNGMFSVPSPPNQGSQSSRRSECGRGMTWVSWEDVHRTIQTHSAWPTKVSWSGPQWTTNFFPMARSRLRFFCVPQWTAIKNGTILNRHECGMRSRYNFFSTRTWFLLRVAAGSCHPIALSMPPP